MEEPTNSKLAAAFVAAQKEFAPLKKNAVNPHFRNKYADLQACIESVQPALNKHGLALVQQTWDSEDGVKIETVLIHASGERQGFGMLSVPADKQTPQGYGSALTYARRYSISSAFGLVSEPDDDGNAASAPKIDAGAIAKRLGGATTLEELGAIWSKLSASEKKAGETAKNLMKVKLEKGGAE